MKKFIFLLILILVAGCNTFKDVGKVMRNEKTTTTDEFLVKKKEPLVLPPNYNEIPEPDSLKKQEIGEDEKIKKILKSSTSTKKNKKGITSVEKKIIDRIKSD
tara:strand:- start:307 stop:615 length:309 start_codon:yes stop_codon:yes gene_type:complete